MRTASLLIGLCMMLAVAMNVAAYQQRTHPEIMQDVSSTRQTLADSIEGGNAEAVVTAAERLEGYFREEAIPIYQRMNLSGAAELANKAAAAAAEAAAAGRQSNMEAAGAAHGTLRGLCGNCHMQFREKAPDGSYRFKTQ